MGLKIKSKAKAPELACGPAMAGEDTINAGVGQGSTSVEYPDGSIVDSKEVVGEAKVYDAPAYVTISMGLTRNLGNYESVKLHVGVTLPCAPTSEDIDATYQEGKGWVDARINQLNQELTDSLGQ